MKKKTSKLAVFLPILLGVMIALVLMVIGDIEDAPGLYAIETAWRIYSDPVRSQ